jgi:LPXTG-site transpeptidase (sortase) family protein
VADRRSASAAAAGLVLAAGGALLWWTQPTGAVSADPATSPDSVQQTDPNDRPDVAPRRPGDPDLLRIPALHVSAPVIAVHASGSALVPPSDPSRVGWWADGARPGAARGSALIAGHTVHTGGGALDDLEDLRSGDEIAVRTDNGPVEYVVGSVRVYSKGRTADVAEQLFSQDVTGRLVVITCEDWDGERYLSNVVVTATPRD